MTPSPRTFVSGILLALVLPGAVVALACANTEKPAAPQEETLVEMCLRRGVEVYEKFDLPYTKPEAERPQACRDLISENDITNKAELEILFRQYEKELKELDS